MTKQDAITRAKKLRKAGQDVKVVCLRSGFVDHQTQRFIRVLDFRVVAR